jgi:hypothetical protein
MKRKHFEEDNTGSNSVGGCMSPPSFAGCTTSRPVGRAILPDPADTDKLLSSELQELSLQERNRIYDEVHGVADAVEEDIEFIETCLADLSLHINRIRKRSAYERALFMFPRYVKDRAFRLSFLRAERFDTKDAAKRMVNFFQLKLDLFGLDKLVKDITLDDLDETARGTIALGETGQVLSTLDRSGRHVLIFMGNYFGSPETIRSMVSVSILRSMVSVSILKLSPCA